jgi:hypothetical protein
LIAFYFCLNCCRFFSSAAGKRDVGRMLKENDNFWMVFWKGIFDRGGVILGTFKGLSLSSNWLQISLK